MLRALATPWHRAMASTRAGAILYTRWLGLMRGAWPRMAAARLCNNLGSVAWPDIDLPAYRTCVGSSTWVALHPHFEEFDLEALVSPRLSYEREVFHCLESRLDAFDVVVEIGANVGVFTVFFGTRFREAGKTGTRVFAFEPSTKAYARLLANLRANGLDNVASFNVALDGRAGVLEFFEPAGHLTNGSLVRDFAAQFSSELRMTTVVTISGAELAAMVPAGAKVLIKLDVEGAEARVLDGLDAFIRERRPVILLEVLNGYEASILASAPLRSHGYRYFEIRPEGLVHRDTILAGTSRDWWLEPAST